MNITEAIFAHARDRPDHPAIEDGARIVTYALLARMTEQAATALRRHGIAKGDIVVVALPDTPEHVALLLALAKIGAVSFSLDFNSPPSDSSKAARGLVIRAAVEVSQPSHFPEAEPLLLAALFAEPADDRVAEKIRDFDPDTAVMIVQSSGTTGEPKRIVMTHRQMAERNRRSLALLELSAADRYLQVPQLRFFDGRRRCIKMLMLGATVVLARDEVVDDYPHLISTRRISYAYLTPYHLRGLLGTAGHDGPLWPKLKIVLGMAPSTAGERQRARHRLTPCIFDTYGTNEIGTVVISTPSDQLERPESIGRVIAGIEAQVVDAHDAPLPAGETGLIGFRGPHFTDRYIADAATTARFFRHGWFYPGDFAAISDDGYVFLKGRADDVINRSGTKYFPSEVESVLSTHPAIAEVAVIGGPHPQFGEVSVAFVVRAAALTHGDILHFCATRIATYKAPPWVCFVSSIPKAPPKNPDKKRLKELFAANLEATSQH